MIAFTRLQARHFRAVLKKCVGSRARPPDPPVVLRLSGKIVTLSAAYTNVALELAVPAQATRSTGNAELVVSAKVLEEAEGTTDDVVEIRDEGKLKGTAWWPVGDGIRSDPIELILPGKHHSPLPRPAQTVPMSAQFQVALHECGRCAARDDGRFALSKVQLRGKAGRIAGTDGQAAILFDGFTFPFPDDLLVPAVPLFGSYRSSNSHWFPTRKEIPS